MYTGLLESLASVTDLVVWSSGSLQHTALLWMICAFLGERPRTNVQAVVSDRGRERLDDQFGCIELEFRSDEIRALLGNGRELGLGARRAAARNWRAFTGRLPTAFNNRCRAAGISELNRFGKYHAGFFPRLAEKGLRVSLLDELLLTCVGEAWSLPSQIILRQSPEGIALRSWLACAGDVSLGRRLRDWARHSIPDPVLESETTESDHILRGVRYRLSSRGRALLKQGIRSVAEAPTCFIGGGTAYDPQVPVAASGNADWKLVRL